MLGETGRKAAENHPSAPIFGLKGYLTHSQHSPAKIAYKKVQANRTEGLKLNANQVKSIKKILNDKNRKITIKRLAEKYGVSEMTMYRIKSGENWGRIR